MGVINSPLVEGGVFSEEVNKKEVTVNGANSNGIFFCPAPASIIQIVCIYTKLFSISGVNK